MAVIELNGKRYNALTGAPLDGVRSLDGFVSNPTPATTNATPQEQHRITVHRAEQHHTPHHPVQHSQTLMRQSVHRPGDSWKRHANATTHTGVLAKTPQLTITPKHSAQGIDRSRLERAGQISRSGYVRRFATGSPAPRGDMAFTPRPMPPQVQSNMVSPMPEIAARQPSQDVFERALAAANSHKEPYAPVNKHRAHRKGRGVRIALSVASSLAAVALIAGFVAYQNMALIQLKLASSHAGMNATLPIWQPSGFSLSAFNYSHNNVAITYADKVSGQKYVVSQSPSDWNAETLLSTYVYPNNQTYDTLTSGSTTIYTYGNNNATWVSHGIWYKLISSGSLSNSQIVNIATSMRS